MFYYAFIKSVHQDNLVDIVNNSVLDLTIRIIQLGRFMYFALKTYIIHRSQTVHVFFDGSLTNTKKKKKKRKWWERNGRRNTVEHGQENTV